MISNKVWDPYKDLNTTKQIPKRIINRYFNSVLPELNTSGVLFGGTANHSLKNIKSPYKRLSLQLDHPRSDVVGINRFNNKNKLFPYILSPKSLLSKSIDDKHKHDKTNSFYKENENCGEEEKVKISYATFNFPIDTKQPSNLKQHQFDPNEVLSIYTPPEPLSTIDQNISNNTRPHHFIYTNNKQNNKNKKSRTCPNTPKITSDRRCQTPPPLSYINVGFFPRIYNNSNNNNNNKSSRTNPNSASHYSNTTNEPENHHHKMPPLVPKFAYHASALSPVKKSDILDCSAPMEHITKDKVQFLFC